MSRLLKQLKDEEFELTRRISLLEKRIPRYPEGILHASKCNGSYQYYFKDGSKETNRKTYLKKENQQLAVSLAQRDYEGRLLTKLQARQDAVRRAIKVYEDTDPEKVLGGFSQGKQVLINPLFLTKEEFASRWQAVEYEKKTFKENTPEIYTVRGERVRSKSEKIIADTLLRFQIPYRYEYPLELKGYGRIHPDFMVLNVETREEFFWEHLGRMDDEEYVRENMIRLHAYEKNHYLIGKELIVTAETKTLPLDMKVLDQVIERFLL